MKTLLFFLAIFCGLKAFGQDYHITFRGSGASLNVSTVNIENLTAGTALSINGSDILHLTAIITEVISIPDIQLSKIKIYPNPMTDFSVLEIFPPEVGDATISICDMTGKPLARIRSYLENSSQKFRISGLNNGFYLISINGNSFQYSGKLLCTSNPVGSIRIEKISSVMTGDEKYSKMSSKELQATADMLYTEGDRLKFKGISGNFATVIIDIPAFDKTINFNFIPCTDGDHNNYPVVEIGTQLWMAENLKTTKYNDETIIQLVTDETIWDVLVSPAYCWYNNNVTSKDVFGGLYNSYNTDPVVNGSKNVCPTGWHVPTDSQWSVLTSYLVESEAGNKLKETGTAHWWYPNSSATNESGFTALPGGYRAISLGYRTEMEGGTWWTSTEFDSNSAWERGMNISRQDVYRAKVDKRYGFSIRCLKGEPKSLPTLRINTGNNISYKGLHSQ